jgi:hypothetical protein
MNSISPPSGYRESRTIDEKRLVCGDPMVSVYALLYAATCCADDCATATTIEVIRLSEP